MHIGIYINNENISSVDCKNLLAGNPGIGGTEYCVLLLAQAYKMYYSNNKVTLFVAKQGILPEVDNYVVVNGIDDLPAKAQKEDVDVLVVSAVYNGIPLPQSFFDDISAKKIKTILWGHNFYLNDFCNKICKCEYAKANVFVGRQQYDRYIDHAVINKSTYIYNMYPETDELHREKIQNHAVTYIGSLVPTKGFHVLAAVWKTILKEVPDATLNVVGNGKLYGRNSKLGKYNIAEDSYEKQFMPGLTDDEGNILPSVHFWGVLGVEKNDVIRNTCVGVVNPTGRTETFGISALDFESMSVPVVTIAKGGFLDTVLNEETGLLYGHTDDFAKDIIMLLKNDKLNEQYGRDGIQLCKKFTPDKIIKEWNRLFLKVLNDEKMEYIEPDSFMETNLKKYRCLNRKIKNAIGVEYPISVIGAESFARNVLRRMGK